MALSLSSFNVWIVAWFGLIPLFFVLNNQSWLKALISGFLWGLVFWSFTVYWLVHVTLPGTMMLVVYLSIYTAIFGFLSVKVSGCRFYLKMFFIPAAWVCLEYLRGHLLTGFPWALLAYSQYTNLPLIQIADFSGAWGVSFLVVLVNYVLYVFLAGRKNKPLSLLPLVLIFSFCLFYGFFRLAQVKVSAPGKACEIKISVIQANIAQELKWDKSAQGYILQSYRQLTRGVFLDAPDLIIWPEAAAPGLFGQDKKLFDEIFVLAQEAKSNLLLGAVSRINENYFNSALLVDQNGQIDGIYHKLHLVPFGEYIPLKNVFPFLENIVPIGDISPGKEYFIFEKPAKFGVLICFEDLFAELSRQFVRRGALFLINITNDAWYKQSSAASQHFAASVFRAIENRVYLVRAANTGISGFINPQGRVSACVRKNNKLIFVPGSKTENIQAVFHQATFYNRYGDLFVFFCFCFAAYVLIKYSLRLKGQAK
ncbi:MAG: apolipoprotein N-acyltransferase [Candidatus Omnitrophica bacterium]|nr:apolipoprotein N-acyltransferase [Candidatus Omnitrophota bacterium]